MSFVFALILWVIIGIIWSSEKHQEKEHNKKSSAAMSAMKAWEKQVVDGELESRYNHIDYKERMKMADEGLLEIFGDQETVDRFKRCYMGQKNDTGYQKRIYLAKHGKLSWVDAHSGITALVLMRTDLSIEDARQYAHDIKKFIFWIDAQLKKHGVYQHLYVGNPNVKPRGYCLAINAPADFAVHYCWEPATGLFPKCSTVDELYEAYEKKYGKK